MKTNGNAETAGIEKPRQHNFLRLWGGLVQRTFPFMEEEVGELGPKARLFVTVCETVVKPEWLEAPLKPLENVYVSRLETS